MARDKQEPQVSVIVASSVGKPFIDRCLRSLERQARRNDAEVLVATGAGDRHGSRAYARERARSQSILHRLVYLLAGPLIPFVLLARIGRVVLAKGRRVPEFVRTLPLMVPALIVLVAGERVAYLVGPGDALSKVE